MGGGQSNSGGIQPPPTGILIKDSVHFNNPSKEGGQMTCKAKNSGHTLPLNVIISGASGISEGDLEAAFTALGFKKKSLGANEGGEPYVADLGDGKGPRDDVKFEQDGSVVGSLIKEDMVLRYWNQGASSKAWFLSVSREKATLEGGGPDLNSCDDARDHFVNSVIGTKVHQGVVLTANVQMVGGLIAAGEAGGKTDGKVALITGGPQPIFAY